MRSIYTYTKLDDLCNAPYYPDIRDLPHVAMSKMFSTRLEDLGLFDNLFTFPSITNKMCWNWENSDSKGLLFISKYLHSRLKNATDDTTKKWLIGCMKNSFQLLSAIRMLTEAGVSPSDVESTDSNILLMKNIWYRLIDDCVEFKEFEDAYSPSNIWFLEDIISTKLPESRHRQMVLHGFYYFTPKQERIIRLLEGLGFDLIFLIPFDSTYPYANEIWLENYSVERGFPPLDEWNTYGESHYNALGEVLEGRSPNSGVPKVIEYPSIMSFVKDVASESDSDCMYYSPDPGSSNELLERFYPEKYGHRNLLSYPVGRFIHTLYSLWDEELGDVRLNTDDVMSCFVSGWISLPGFRSNDYVSDLVQLIPFFRGCNTLSEWSERLDLLNHVYVDVRSPFESDCENPFECRWHDVLGNPFLNFSMFNLETERLRVVIDTINLLLHHVKTLFMETEYQSVDSHLNGLRAILGIQSDGRDDLAFEHDCAKKILEEMEHGVGPEWFHSSEIPCAIRLYLSNEAHDDDTEPDDSKVVLSMYDMQSAKGPIHICLSDSRRLPGKETDFIWPLTRDFMEGLCKDTESDFNPLIRDAWFISTMSPVSNRYLTYQAFNSGDVTLSWICDDGVRTIPGSPYIQLFNETGEQESQSNPDNLFSTQESFSSRIPDPIMEPMCLRDFDVIEDAEMEYSLCPRRFLYSYVLKRNPTFVSEFHQSFALSGLLSALKKLDTGYSNEEIEGALMELFPNLRRSEKQNVVEMAPRPLEPHTIGYCNRRYTNQRFMVKFPPSIRSKMDALIDDADYDAKVSLVNGVSKKELCMFCPHSDYCSDCRFIADGDD